MKFKQKYIIFICSIFLLNSYSYSQNPKKNWKRYKHVEQSGFSIEKLDIAIPLQMQDYRIMDGEYYYELEYSIHPAYHMKMSARDLARYGQLFLQNGLWNDKQIFSKKWVDNSTYPVSKHGGGGKIGRWYGWLWGVHNNV